MSKVSTDFGHVLRSPLVSRFDTDVRTYQHATGSSFSPDLSPIVPLELADATATHDTVAAPSIPLWEFQVLVFFGIIQAIFEWYALTVFTGMRAFVD